MGQIINDIVVYSLFFLTFLFSWRILWLEKNNKDHPFKFNIKMVLWKLGAWPNICPYCSLKLIKHYGKSEYVYTCPVDKCKFNKEC